MIGISSEKWSGKLGEVPRRVKHHTSTSSSRGSFRAKVPISPRKAYIWSNYSDLTRPHPKKVAEKKDIPLFQGNLGWWNIVIWPDICPLNLHRPLFCCWPWPLFVSLLVCVFHVGLSLTTVMRQTATHIAWIYLRWCLFLSDHGKSPFCPTIWENIMFSFSKHPTSKSKIYSKAEAETFYTKTSVIPTWKHQKQLSNEKKHGCLGYIGDYTTQFIWGLIHKTMT